STIFILSTHKATARICRTSSRPMTILLIVIAHFSIFFALLWIGEHLIGLINLLKSLFRGSITGVHIWMILACQLAMCLAYLFLALILAVAPTFLLVFIVTSSSHL